MNRQQTGIGIEMSRFDEEPDADPHGECAAEIHRLKAQVEALTAELAAVLQQAQQWKQEARTQASIVRECYQACTGSTGEPGDWNGTDLVRKLVAERDYARAKADRMLSILLGIHQLLDPPINEVDGIKYKFVNPNAAEVLHKLSEKIRAIPDAIDADIAKGTA